MGKIEETKPRERPKKDGYETKIGGAWHWRKSWLLQEIRKNGKGLCQLQIGDLQPIWMDGEPEAADGDK